MYGLIALHISPLIPFATINNISISVYKSSFTLVFLKTDCYTNPDAAKN